MGAASCPLVCFRSCGATRDVIDFLRSRGFEPNVVLSSDHNETLQGAVAAGLGAALIPRLSLDLSDSATELYGLGEDGPVRLVSIIWHAERSVSASVQSFVAGGAGSLRQGVRGPRASDRRNDRAAPRGVERLMPR